MSAAIGSVGQLVAVIRSQLAGRPPTAAKVASRRAATDKRYADSNLAGLIELRVAQIGRDDPQRGRKAFRVFLESVLLAHLGETMLNDPQFFQLLDEVQVGMERDPACAALIATAIEHLLSEKP